MEALYEFEVTVTFCFTPEHLGIAPHHTSAPQVSAKFADFCAAMVERYADHIRPIKKPLRVAQPAALP
jgi:beta-xylosidase